MKKLDLTGHRYGRLLVESESHSDPVARSMFWNCLCDCGSRKKISGSGLRRGTAKSCGCLSIEMTRKRNASRLYESSHGDTKNGRRSTEYVTWLSMRQRCSDPKHVGYARYGARGIKVCYRWANSFENFLSDMGRKPSKSHSLDRINFDGDYTPENCRWATWDQQQNNKSTNVLLTVRGETKTYTQWADVIGTSLNLVRYRAKKLLDGSMTEDQFLSPAWSIAAKNFVELDGKKMTIQAAADELGITYQGMRSRIINFRLGNITFDQAVSREPLRYVRHQK
jgi:hypothetical protein